MDQMEIGDEYVMVFIDQNGELVYWSAISDSLNQIPIPVNFGGPNKIVISPDQQWLVYSNQTWKDSGFEDRKMNVEYWVSSITGDQQHMISSQVNIPIFDHIVWNGENRIDIYAGYSETDCPEWIASINPFTLEPITDAPVIEVNGELCFNPITFSWVEMYLWDIGTFISVEPFVHETSLIHTDSVPIKTSRAYLIPGKQFIGYPLVFGDGHKIALDISNIEVSPKDPQFDNKTPSGFFVIDTLEQQLFDYCLDRSIDEQIIGHSGSPASTLDSRFIAWTFNDGSSGDTVVSVLDLQSGKIAKMLLPVSNFIGWGQIFQ